VVPQHPANILSRLVTRAEALQILRIGETSLHWLQRTHKLRPIRIGSRVLFNAAEIERIAMRGATLTGAEKEAAAPQPRRRGRPPKRRDDNGAVP
jgi:helix-turn-helix protein